MPNYWYVARSNEFLIDMDRPEKSTEHFLRRLAGAVEYEKFKVQYFEMHHSRSGSHLHFLITLENHFLCEIERVVWTVVLHSDIYRACSTLMRLVHGVDAPDLLITPQKFRREPDDTCECNGKHDAETMKICPAAIRLRGDDRARGFFGVPSKKNFDDMFRLISCNNVTGFPRFSGKND